MNDQFAAMQASMVRMSDFLALSFQGKGQGDASTSSAAILTPNSTSIPEQQVHPNNTSLPIGKIELPTFEGTDSIGWLARVEKYFAIHHTREDLKVPTAFISMEGWLYIGSSGYNNNIPPSHGPNSHMSFWKNLVKNCLGHLSNSSPCFARLARLMSSSLRFELELFKFLVSLLTFN